MHARGVRNRPSDRGKAENNDTVPGSFSVEICDPVALVSEKISGAILSHYVLKVTACFLGVFLRSANSYLGRISVSWIRPTDRPAKLS